MTDLQPRAAVRATATGPTVRFRSVDAFRGAVLAFMVLTPATGDPATYPFLRHAPWDGATASDLILPTFLVTSGLSLAFLLRPPVGSRTHRRLLRRLVALVLLGLAYNAYGTTGTDLGSLRFTGVLQMIGVSGFLAAVVVLATRSGGRDRPWRIAAVAFGIQLVHGIGLRALGDRCDGIAACSPYARWDATVLGAEHTYGGGVPGYDPEGIVVVVAATSLVLVGYLAGLRLRAAPTASQRGWVAATTAAAGAVLLSLAWLLDGVDPANKRLLTPAFVALAAGVALIGFAAFLVVLDVVGARRRRPPLQRAALPLVALGRNALVVYLLERFLLQTADMVRVGDRSLRRVVLDGLPGTDTTRHLAYTAAVLLVVVAVTAVLHRRRWYVAL